MQWVKNIQVSYLVKIWGNKPRSREDTKLSFVPSRLCCKDFKLL